jgi:oxygen-independent coproporphyrinogen-3 oxidase
MNFGIYIHIPYCLQRCTYCDFATYEQSKIMPPERYLSLLFEEIRQTHAAYSKHLSQSLTSIYFGGGTPSLLPADYIVSILEELAKYGFTAGPQTEVTLEINPATINSAKMQTYLQAGINRFSVGAQTFDDTLLRSVHREHTAQQTRETLDLLRSHEVNFSFDILFALPHQTRDGLRRDLEEVLRFQPHHVSPYCLTVPEGHVLTKNRPLEEEQVEMFHEISRTLTSAGYHRYEISNFARPGFASRHNSLYWDDSAYWGLGLSAHSYAHAGEWGLRFWNASAISSYEEQVNAHRGKKFSHPAENLPEAQQELLEAHQALTDFCHVSLRREEGLSEPRLLQKFGEKIHKAVVETLLLEQSKGNVLRHNGSTSKETDFSWRLTEEGLLLSNQVFAALTFLKSEIIALTP